MFVNETRMDNFHFLALEFPFDWPSSFFSLSPQIHVHLDPVDCDVQTGCVLLSGHDAPGRLRPPGPHSIQEVSQNRTDRRSSTRPRTGCFLSCLTYNAITQSLLNMCQGRFPLFRVNFINLLTHLLLDDAKSNGVALEVLQTFNSSPFWTEWFKSNKVSLIISTCGTHDERRLLGQASVAHRIPLIDAGSNLGAGHLQVVIPDVTESRDCSQDPLDSSPPFCVVKSFPQDLDHAAIWARAKAANWTTVKPLNSNKIFEENGYQLENIEG